MDVARPLLIVLLALALLVGGGIFSSAGAVQPVTAVADTDGDGFPDPADPGDPQPGEDQCPLLAEDSDGVDDGDGCPDTDASASAVTDGAYAVTVSTVDSRPIDIWFQNGNYAADLLVHVLAVSTVGACEVTLYAEAGDQELAWSSDEDGDTIAETRYHMLEWEISLGAGGSNHTVRDYDVLCSLLGEHSFEIQVDAAPLSPVREEDVADLRNVHKTFPLVTVNGTAIDSDSDGFTDDIESFVGSSASATCAATPSEDDEDPDAYPPDFNDDRFVDVTDVSLMGPPVFNAVQGAGENPTYDQRYDVNADAMVDITDVSLIGPPVFNPLAPCPP